MPALAPGSSPSGFLRLLVVFHESEALGAGRSVLQAVEPLQEYGWTVSGWFPATGLLEEAAGSIPDHGLPTKADPLQHARLARRARHRGAASRYARLLRAFRQMLPQARPHVVHANTLRTLPEARVAHSLGLPVVVHVHELPPAGAKRTLTLRAAAETADVLVVVSEAVACVVRPHARATPILVAYNGVAVASDGSAKPRRPRSGRSGRCARRRGRTSSSRRRRSPANVIPGFVSSTSARRVWMKISSSSAVCPSSRPPRRCAAR